MVASREKVLCLYCWLCWRRPTNFPTPKTDSSRFPAAGFALRVAWASTPVPRLMPNATKPPTAGSWSPSHHRSPAPPPGRWHREAPALAPVPVPGCPGGGPFLPSGPPARPRVPRVHPKECDKHVVAVTQHNTIYTIPTSNVYEPVHISAPQRPPDPPEISRHHIPEFISISLPCIASALGSISILLRAKRLPMNAPWGIVCGNTLFFFA